MQQHETQLLSIRAMLRIELRWWSRRRMLRAEQERVERQVRAEGEEARQLAVAIQVSMDQTSVSGWQGMMKGDGGIDEQFRELCEAAGVAPEDIYQPIATTGSNRIVEERVFARKCRRAWGHGNLWGSDATGSEVEMVDEYLFELVLEAPSRLGGGSGTVG